MHSCCVCACMCVHIKCAHENKETRPSVVQCESLLAYNSLRLAHTPFHPQNIFPGGVVLMRAQRQDLCLVSTPIASWVSWLRVPLYAMLF